MVSRLNRWGACGEAFNVVWELVLMGSCRLRPFVRMFLLFCLVAMMCQQTFLYGLILDVNGETTLTSNGSIDLPHVVTEATCEVFFKPLGAWIDLYTQYPEPFGGQGPNKPADMFWPQKEVILHAEVIYNEWPEQNKDVAFQIIDPHGTTWAALYNRTGEDGVAKVSFRTPWSHDDPEHWFGEWTVIANAEVAEESINDTLTFKYDYLVNTWVVSTDKDLYEHRETIEVTVDYGSYAIQNYDITYAVTGVDESGCCFGYDNMTVTIGGAEYCVCKNGTIKLYISVPNFTCIGIAKIYVGASDWLGNPVTPPYTLSIRIEARLRDVAVLNVWTNVTEVYEGEPVDIATLVANKGNVAETFNVNVYANVTQIDSLKVEALNSGETRTLTLTWETSEVKVGNYTVWAEIPPLPDEYDTTNNVFIDGIVEIKPKLPIFIHDIAITDVQISNNSVYIGELLQINVSVTNKGTETETFNVSTYYDSSLIETSQVKALAPNTQTTLIFVWNTSSVKEDCYQISASAFLPSDINVSDNTFVDGVVWVKSRVFPAVWEVPRWLLALLFLLAVFIGACLAAAIVFALLWRRCERKKKRRRGGQPTHPEVGFKRSKTCSVCGKEFPGTYTFCPYCFTFHGKDYE